MPITRLSIAKKLQRNLRYGNFTFVEADCDIRTRSAGAFMNAALVDIIAAPCDEFIFVRIDIQTAECKIYIGPTIKGVGQVYIPEM